MQVAVKYGNRFTVSFILDLMDDRKEGDNDAMMAIETSNADGRSGLHFAAMYNQPKIARLLIRRGQDPSFQDNDGNAVLHHACKSNSTEVFEAVLDEVEAIRGRNYVEHDLLPIENYNEEATALSLAMENTNTKIILRIVKDYGIIGLNDFNNSFVVYSAALVGSIELLRLLVDVIK